MAVKDIDTLKSYFLDGEVPNENDYDDLIDSLGHSYSLGISAFMGIPGLRGLWPMNILDPTGKPPDISSNGLDLTMNGNPVYYQFDHKHPYISFDGAGDYCSYIDTQAFDILGSESYIGDGSKGLSLGGWFSTRELAPANNRGIMGKWNSDTGNQRSYELMIFNEASKFSFLISNDGSGWYSVTGNSVPLSTNTWYFVVCRFKPSTEISISINGTDNQLLSAFKSVLYIFFL